MLTAAFLTVILFLVTYLLLSPRKEVPMVIVLHAIFQYALTLAFWVFHMNSFMAGLSLGFIVFTTGVLIWARSLNYSPELHTIRLFFTLGQWALLLGVGIFVSVKSPYSYLVPSASWYSHINPQQLSIHPVVKLSANVLLFTTFFQVIGHWGQRWSVRQSLLELGPLFVYVFLVALLRFFQSASYAYPFS
jgi:hypothetical protein